MIIGSVQTKKEKKKRFSSNKVRKKLYRELELIRDEAHIIPIMKESLSSDKYQENKNI